MIIVHSNIYYHRASWLDLNIGYTTVDDAKIVDKHDDLTKESRTRCKMIELNSDSTRKKLNEIYSHNNPNVCNDQYKTNTLYIKLTSV